MTEQRKNEQTRREFVANVSHELRTPLTNIRSYAETIISAGDDLSPELRNNFLGVILGEADRMGATVEQAGGYVCADAPEGGLLGGHVYLDIVSVGATMNILLAAVLSGGLTIIENCAKEPHIVDLANFLNAMAHEMMEQGVEARKKAMAKAKESQKAKSEE